MVWAQFVVQWVHVLLGILWFGYALSMSFLVSPALARLPESAQRDANLHLGELAALLATVALFLTGARFLGPAYVGLKEAPDFAAAIARVRRIAQFDLGLFFVIFTCVILMRFGL